MRMWAHMDWPITPVPIQPTRVVDGLMGSTVVVVVVAVVDMVRWREKVGGMGVVVMVVVVLDLLRRGESERSSR